MKNPMRIGMLMAAMMLGGWLWGAACGGGGSFAPLTGPTVTANTLAKVLTSGTTANIAVTFSTEMNAASVEAAFTVTGSDPVPGTFTWAGNTVTFAPTTRWRTHHEYTLTIGMGATDALGNPMTAAYTATFRPELNMHDVNGDGIDDFMLGAPGHDYDAIQTNAGAAYLFLGKTTWANVDFATQTADATYMIAQKDFGLGLAAKIVGDINGDGYADMVMSGAVAPGYILIVYGSTAPANISLVGADVSALSGMAAAAADNVALGFPVMPVGDVNGDGLADFVLGSQIDSTDDSKFWLVLGRTDAFPMPPSPVVDPSQIPKIDTIANASFSVFKSIPFSGFPVAGCDVNGDELSDLVFGSSEFAGGGTMRGQVLVVAGSTSPVSRDLRTVAADQTITGATDNERFGAAVMCGNINGDRYADIIGTAPYSATTRGRAYVIAGAATFTNYNLATDAPLATYTGANTTDAIGFGGCVQGDVNNDGFDDAIIGAPLMTVEGSPNRGSAYLFLGATTPASVDLGAGQSAQATYVGVIPPAGQPTTLGYCARAGDVNGDGIDDILVGAPLAHGAGLQRGQVYLIFGSASPMSYNFETQTADATFTGAANEDFLSVQCFGL